jgi:hypothetical protein
MSLLTIPHFITAVLARSLLHGSVFSILTMLFYVTLSQNMTFGLAAALLIAGLYCTSYVVHELGHYKSAEILGAQPLVWIDYSSVSVLSNPQKASHGRIIALTGPIAAALWISLWLAIFTFISSALSFATLIPGVLLASAHLGNLLPVFSDGKALTQRQLNRSYS